MDDDRPLPDPEAPEQTTIQVQDLVRMCVTAANHMSRENPHRLLFLNCGYALQQLMNRCAFYEDTTSGKVQ